MKRFLYLFFIAFLAACSHDWTNPLETDEDLKNIPVISDIKSTADSYIELVLDRSYSGDANIVLEREENSGYLIVKPFRSSQSAIVDTSFENTLDHTFTYRIYVEKNGYKTDYSTPKEYIYEAPNQAPTARFSVNSLTGDTATVFSFNASASSDNEDTATALQVRWDWENDGTWDTGYTTTKTANHQYTTAGTYTVTLEVKDTGGLTATATKQISVTNASAPAGMVFVQGGTFIMGDTWGDGESDEKPTHSVTVSSFYMGKYEITNAQVAEVYNWALGQGKLTVSSSSVRNNEGNAQELLDLNASRCEISYNGSQLVVDSGKDDYPVIEISWYGAVAYCNYVSEKEGYTVVYNLSDWSLNWSSNGYRLPTEAEWEYAARGGAGSNGYKYSGSNTIDDVAWYYSNSGGQTHTVGTKQGNELGLYDMSGNVWEWCSDWYGSSYYSSSPSNNPPGPASGSYRVLRGGSWVNLDLNSRVANRYRNYPSDSYYYNGFRLVRE
jgi:formylglycine-generating enzyme required for sulfatase activity